MLSAPRSLPIYRDGKLAFFADARTFIGSPIPDSSSVSRCTTEASSSSGGFSPNQSHAGAAARPFNLDAFFMGVPANAEGEGA